MAQPKTQSFKDLADILIPFISLIKNFRSTYGDASVTNMAAAYKLLWSWVKENMTDLLDSPQSRHERLLGALERIQKMAKKGRYGGRKKKTDNFVDPALTGRILENYFVSRQRRERLDAIQEDGLEPGQQSMFLALETYLRGNGVRLDVVRNLRVSDIMAATPTYTRCPFCQVSIVHFHYCADV